MQVLGRGCSREGRKKKGGGDGVCFGVKKFSCPSDSYRLGGSLLLLGGHPGVVLLLVELLGELPELLTDHAGLLLLGEHDLEAVEIVEGSPLLAEGDLLSPRGGLPLLLDAGLSVSLDEGLQAGRLLDLDLEVGQGEPLEGNSLPLDTSDAGRTIDEGLN